jgi:hypothetical protein
MRLHKNFFLLLVILSFSTISFAQTETLTNAEIIEMTKAGLGRDLILSKIKSSHPKFDVSVNALIELKKASVDDEVISAMIEKPSEASPQDNPANYSESGASAETASFSKPAIVSPKAALLSAKTVAIGKSSLQPSRQALDKELLKLSDWKKLNLTIIQFKNDADIYIQIGFVHGSFITHRYVYRIFDRRTGAVLAAGETTSWGSLAENLARHIAKSLNNVLNSRE